MGKNSEKLGANYEWNEWHEFREKWTESGGETTKYSKFWGGKGKNKALGWKAGPRSDFRGWRFGKVHLREVAFICGRFSGNFSRKTGNLQENRRG
jgi:hypothetical protein